MKSVKWLVVAAVATVLVVSATETQAGKGLRVPGSIRGKVFILSKRPPARFGSGGAMVGFLRRHKLTHVWPHKKHKDRWKLEIMAFFRSPLNDIEVQVKFYDVTARRKFRMQDSIYMTGRGQEILATSLELMKDDFEINRHYEMQLVSKRQKRVVAKTRFWLRGKGEVYSGRVEFSDEDAKLNK